MNINLNTNDSLKEEELDIILSVLYTERAKCTNYYTNKSKNLKRAIEYAERLKIKKR